MKIAGYLKTSLIEWPGKISSVIFVPGCNWRCPFCHNADLVDPKRIKKLPQIAEKEILTDLKKRKKWIDGVVVTGGEPTLQPDLPAFLQKCRTLGFVTMLETNGSKPTMIRKLLQLKLLDYLAMDIKGPLKEEIKKSLKIILKSGVPFELRTTVVPTIHNPKILKQMARQLEKIFRESHHTQFVGWVLQTFQPNNCLEPKFEKIKPFSRIELENLLKTVKKVIPQARLRGE